MLDVNTDLISRFYIAIDFLGLRELVNPLHVLCICSSGRSDLVFRGSVLAILPYSNGFVVAPLTIELFGNQSVLCGHLPLDRDW